MGLWLCEVTATHGQLTANLWPVLRQQRQQQQQQQRLELFSIFNELPNERQFELSVVDERPPPRSMLNEREEAGSEWKEEEEEEWMGGRKNYNN
jgi:hypothetical protein